MLYKKLIRTITIFTPVALISLGANAVDVSSNKMVTEPMTSVSHTHTIMVDYPVKQAAKLFTAIGEVYWTPNWSPKLIKGDGFSKNDIFLNTDDNNTIFIVNEYDEDNGYVAYSRIAPGVSAGTIEIHITPKGDSSAVEITYNLTALTPSAQKGVAQLTAPVYENEIEQWKSDIEDMDGTIRSWLISLQ